jgi:hypothetical protein
MKKLLFLGVLAFLLFSCKKENNSPSEFVDAKYITPGELFNCITCFSPSNLNSNGFVIKDENSYKKFADLLRIYPYNPNINCDTATLKPIDFNKYSLIGMFTSFGACDSINKSILINSNRTKITYSIFIKKYSGDCVSMLGVSLNFALISKIPDDCTVDFNTKTE